MHIVKSVHDDHDDHDDHSGHDDHSDHGGRADGFEWAGIFGMNDATTWSMQRSVAITPIQACVVLITDTPTEDTMHPLNQC